jgi:hypothetical protein
MERDGLGACLLPVLCYVIQFCGHVTTNDYGVVTNMATISEEGMQTMGEMFETGEALVAENGKADLDVLVDVINEHLDYFNEENMQIKRQSHPSYTIKAYAP